MSNHLSGQTSPYLLQHTENPVDWYPWCQEAFDAAAAQDKPVFLSIGYSTCHWCHVMARESFEDPEIAGLLNQYYICVKVDKEERPDIDSVYMAFCLAYTGSGGWPMSIFMTPRGEPFFAGTYFPKRAGYGRPGLKELLLAVHRQWQEERQALLRSGDEVIAALRESRSAPAEAEEALLVRAMAQYRKSFDPQYGGFGRAPKFPAPHNLLFLMQYSQKHGDAGALEMAERTLLQMYRGGIFDHIGYGFCRYSTDRRFLVPHFEKMLYDNALLLQAYGRAYEITGKHLYLEVAEKTASYLLGEMRSGDGGFYSAQDADSDGAEGKYYTFTPQEINGLLGPGEARAFCAHYGVSPQGNFEGKSIPNLLPDRDFSPELDALLPRLRDYRRVRVSLHRDEKILTGWNALAIAGLCTLYRVSGKSPYLAAARETLAHINRHLREGDVLYVSHREGRRSQRGFLEEYAQLAYALLALYDATLEKAHLEDAARLAERALEEFLDPERGGFYLYGRENEALILHPKECYDGAVPSGNSLMAYVLLRLNALLPEGDWQKPLEKQLRFMAGEARDFPTGYAMYLLALSEHLEPPMEITAVIGQEDFRALPLHVPSGTRIRVLEAPTAAYAPINGHSAFYVCKDHTCMPPVTMEELLRQPPERAPV